MADGPAAVFWAINENPLGEELQVTAPTVCPTANRKSFPFDVDTVQLGEAELPLLVPGNARLESNGEAVFAPFTPQRITARLLLTLDVHLVLSDDKAEEAVA